MYFPNELWREIKNYQLGQKYWKQKMDCILKNLPKCWVFNYRIHTSQTKKTRFTKEIYIPPFFKKPGQTTIVYSMFEGYIPNTHCYENCIQDEDGPNQILEILPG